MKRRKLGKNGPEVSAIGLGAMGMSGMYGPADRAESIATLHAALEAGITLIDTGDFYGMGHNEMLIGEALTGHKRDQVLISVKFGALRGPGQDWLGYDARPAAVKNFLAYTLQRLRVDYIDIYRPARLDPAVPIEETVGAIGDLIKAGYVRYVGLSEVGPATIRRAHAAHPICDLQIEYSLISRGIEDEILPVCRELGIGITAYGVLSRGLISGGWSKERETRGDFRQNAPRFQGENLDKNLALVDRLRAVVDRIQSRGGAGSSGLTAGSASKGAVAGSVGGGGPASGGGPSVAQAAIAWVLAKGNDIVPLIGARRRQQLNEALGALDVELTPQEIAAIEEAVPRDAVAGERYPEAHLRHMDSEQGRRSGTP